MMLLPLLSFALRFYGFGPLALPKSISSVIWPFLLSFFFEFCFFSSFVSVAVDVRES